jgi:hypothetical protein
MLHGSYPWIHKATVGVTDIRSPVATTVKIAKARYQDTKMEQQEPTPWGDPRKAKHDTWGMQRIVIINHFLFYVAPGNPIKEIPWRPRAATPSGRRRQQ